MRDANTEANIIQFLEWAMSVQIRTDNIELARAVISRSAGKVCGMVYSHTNKKTAPDEYVLTPAALQQTVEQLAAAHAPLPVTKKYGKPSFAVLS